MRLFMAEVSIRRAKPGDFDVITQIWQEMMALHLTVDPRFELAIDSKEAYIEYLNSIIGNYDYGIFVAVKENEVIGYTISMILNNPQVFALDRYGFIAEMAVKETEQRSGAGKDLWEHLRKWFSRRGISVIQLNVSPKNERGYNFWKKVGCDEFLHILWHNIPKNL
ncbi:GNAT family N-acetyltransferase [bacterium]|nr:GNAT family N-acetyltransferase [bacterium]